MNDSTLDHVLAESDDALERRALQASWEALGTLEPVEPPRALTAPRPARRRLWLAAAAVVALALLVAVWPSPRPLAIAYDPGASGPARLAAVDGLRSGERLAEIAVGDPSVGVRLRALDRLEAATLDTASTERLIAAATRDDSALVRIRLLELFVDRGLTAAEPAIESLAVDPNNDDLVRESARWAGDRLKERRRS